MDLFKKEKIFYKVFWNSDDGIKKDYKVKAYKWNEKEEVFEYNLSTSKRIEKDLIK